MHNEASGHHISQLFNIPSDVELDFFDANLEFDTPVFIDPFLLKNSPIPTEKGLFDRFSHYFRYAYDRSLEASLGRSTQNQLKRLFAFHEPKNIYMGFTESSNEGHGTNLDVKLLNFFLDNSAKKFVKAREYFPEGQYNPVSLQLFTDGIGPDGISDMTANLIMDYLISYTIEQCDALGIERRRALPLDHDGFDFENMSWRGGGYYDLPENPLKKNEAIIFVPKRLLRGLEERYDNTKGRVFSILRADPELADKFSDLLSKSLKDVSMEDIRAVFMEEGSVHYRYLKNLEQARKKPYDFERDFLSLLADKDYSGYFENDDNLLSISSCSELKMLTERLIKSFNDEFSLRDGWKDAWKAKESSKSLTPQTEPVIGRRFRGMGYALFDLYPDITFIPEAGTGNGFVDFHIIHKNCRILVELKLLNNSSPKGDPKVPAYIHGLTVQLPHYVELVNAKHAFYLTGQHYNGMQKWTKTNHTHRTNEIQNLLIPTERILKSKVPNFESLNYVNVDMTPRNSASNL